MVPLEILDSQILNNFGFKPNVSLREGLIKTYQDYLMNNGNN